MGEPNTDILTQLQEQIIVFCKLLIDDTGLVQRDARPAPIKDEPLIPWTNAPVAENDTSEMAAMLVQQSKVLADLIQHLPVVQGTEDQQLQNIVELQKENHKLAVDLALEMKGAQQQLALVQDLFAVLADERLKSKQPQAKG